MVLDACFKWKRNTKTDHAKHSQIFSNSWHIFIITKHTIIWFPKAVVCFNVKHPYMHILHAMMTNISSWNVFFAIGNLEGIVSHKWKLVEWFLFSEQFSLLNFKDQFEHHWYISHTTDIFWASKYMSWSKTFTWNEMH